MCIRDRTDRDEAVSISSGESNISVPIGETAPSSGDAECTFCSETFTDSKAGELWVECVSCRDWAHVACSGCDRDCYVCDFCS